MAVSLEITLWCRIGEPHDWIFKPHFKTVIDSHNFANHLIYIYIYSQNVSILFSFQSILTYLGPGCEVVLQDCDFFSLHWIFSCVSSHVYGEISGWNPTIILIFEPSHGIMALIVLCKLILQTRMRNHPVWLLVRPFTYFHTSCVRTAKALARLRECAGSPEPLLVAYVMSTIISWAGSLCNFFVLGVGTGV